MFLIFDKFNKKILLKHIQIINKLFIIFITLKYIVLNKKNMLQLLFYNFYNVTIIYSKIVWFFVVNQIDLTNYNI